MKKIAKGLLSLSLISTIVSAGDYYGGLDLDFGKGSTEIKNLGNTQDSDYTQTAFGIHGGYYLNMNSKVEISFKSLKFDFDEGSTDRDGSQLAVDYIYMLENVSQLKPYVGGGISMNSLDIKLSNTDTVDGVGFKLRGGVSYPMNDKLDIGVELNYNYIGWEDLKDLRDDSIIEISSSFYGLGLNLNYRF